MGAGHLEELGYRITQSVFDAQLVVPQHRERIFIVGFRNDLKVNFEFPTITPRNIKVADILENGSIAPKYTLTDKLWKYLQDYSVRQKAKGNGFGFGLVGPDSVTRTLSARYYKDGSEILVYQGENRRPRRLTPRECARLMGFDDTFRIPVSDTQAYRQFGNSVVVPAFAAVAKLLASRIRQAVALRQGEAVNDGCAR